MSCWIIEENIPMDLQNSLLWCRLFPLRYSVLKFCLVLVSWPKPAQLKVSAGFCLSYSHPATALQPWRQNLKKKKKKEYLILSYSCFKCSSFQESSQISNSLSIFSPVWPISHFTTIITLSLHGLQSHLPSSSQWKTWGEGVQISYCNYAETGRWHGQERLIQKKVKSDEWRTEEA